MHGRDQDPEYMRSHLVSPLGLPSVSYVLPRAPGGSWYPGRFFDPLESLEPWLSDALVVLDEAISACGVPVERLVLAGFSQGACIVAEHVARRPARYLGVALLTGTFLGTPEEHTPVGDLDGLPVFVSAGRQDEWIPLEHIEATARAFSAAGASVSVVVTDNTDHVITDEAVAGVRALLQSAPR